jgi:spore germination cell wall hydrolase CwlJ-like protein
MIEAALLCLSLNGYHEARGEPLEGQFAVAQVVLNRAGRDPDKVCDVVFQPHQFSWTLKPSEVKDAAAYAQAQAVARMSLHMHDFTGGATFYHSLAIKPHWASSVQLTGQWGRHIFYKRKGAK